MTREYDDHNTEPELDPHDADAPLAEEHTSGPHADEHDQQDRHDDRRSRPRRERLDSFEKMKVWQEAHQLALRVFATTPNLPAEQQAGLALQMEQTAVSVPKSIAEGFKRRGPRNKAHYYNIAQTAVESLRYYFILCRDLNYDLEYDDLANRAEQVSRMLDGLVRSMSR